MDKFLQLPRGAPFLPSVPGEYRFLYPADEAQLSLTETVAVLVSSGIRCPSHYGNYTPYLVTKKFAQDHSLRYRVIWMNNGN